MRLLIITQKIDEGDPILGFFHSWIAEFAKHCGEVTAIGLSVGTHHLPKNVRVFSLGKERGSSPLSMLWNFYRLIFREQKNYDAVFVHMNPEYVIVGGIPWKMMRKKIGLWYTHKNVDGKLRLAAHGADIIFTASKESFRLSTPKCKVVGHGIDTGRFGGIKHILPGGLFRISSIGRLSRTKDYGVLLRALQFLRNEKIPIRAEIVGDPITADDKTYANELKAEIFHRGLTETILVGGIPNAQIDVYLAKADLFVNMSQTGSLDKAVLEAMAAGIPVLTSNEGLRSTLAGFEQTSLFNEGDAKDFSEHIRMFMHMSERERQLLGEKLRGIVEKNHNLKTLIPRIVTMLRPTI